MIPGRFYPKYLGSRLSSENGQREKTLQVKVKIPSTAIEEIKTEMEEIINGSL
jgi:hypothetical protein